jgi:hypothetical protein
MKLLEPDTCAPRLSLPDLPDDELFSQWPEAAPRPRPARARPEVEREAFEPRADPRAGRDPGHFDDRLLGDAVADAWFK